MYQLVKRTLFESLKDRLEAKEITVKEVAIELYKGGHYPYVPHDEEALQCIGMKKVEL